MTMTDLVPVLVSGSIVAGMYLYLLRERRKVRDARSRGLHPAE